jgi:hypothetical protein
MLLQVEHLGIRILFSLGPNGVKNGTMGTVYYTKELMGV